MDWTNVVYFLVGLGLGAALGLKPSRSRWGKRAPTTVSLVPASPDSTPMPTAIAAGEQEKQALQEQLRQTQLAYHLAAEMSQFKAGFLARSSHELRSPLSSLMGLQQLILSDLCDSPEEERLFVAQSYEAAQRMIKLLDEVINASKVEHGTAALQIQPLPLGRLLEDVYLLTHLQVQNRNLQLYINVPEPEVYILADETHLKQVLMNLVISAIPLLEGGAITWSTGTDGDRGVAYIWMMDDRPASAWAEAIDFMQSPPSPEATTLSAGLTLLMNQNLLELMQGRLELIEGTPNPDTSTYQSPRLQCVLPLAS